MSRELSDEGLSFLGEEGGGADRSIGRWWWKGLAGSHLQWGVAVGDGCNAMGCNGLRVLLWPVPTAHLACLGAALVAMAAGVGTICAIRNPLTIIIITVLLAACSHRL